MPWRAAVIAVLGLQLRLLAAGETQLVDAARAGDANVVRTLLTARADLTEVTNDLGDLQKALALDLTPAGIAAIKGPIEQVNRKAGTSANSLDAFAAELDKIAAALPAPTVAPVK